MSKNQFEHINRGFNHVFKYGELSLGVVIPMENYSQSRIPSMKHHLERVQLAEELGFKSVWLRDVPFDVPAFGDVGQMFDPFTYIGYLAGLTSEIGLGISSIALPLHYPVHVAKAAASIDQLSDGRLILGIASGDRPQEYPAMALDHMSRGDQFRAAYEYLRAAQEPFPVLEKNPLGYLNGSVDILPKATAHKIPMLITGHSQQSLAWNAENGDGWMYYPREASNQQERISEWRDLIPEDQKHNKPFMQPLYVDLHENENHEPEPIHLGFRLGVNHLVKYFYHLRLIGVNHVALNLRFCNMDIEKALKLISEKVTPHFHQ